VDPNVPRSHNETKSQIWFNNVNALHSIAVKETSSSAWLTSGSFKKSVMVPIDCCGLTVCAYRESSMVD
jgi:hypothetical protein